MPIQLFILTGSLRQQMAVSTNTKHNSIHVCNCKVMQLIHVLGLALAQPSHELNFQGQHPACHQESLTPTTKTTTLLVCWSVVTYVLFSSQCESINWFCKQSDVQFYLFTQANIAFLGRKHILSDSSFSFQ